MSRDYFQDANIDNLAKYVKRPSASMGEGWGRKPTMNAELFERAKKVLPGGLRKGQDYPVCRRRTL